MHAGLTIGQVAAAAGVGVETVRYYQRRRLLAVPRKPPGGYRRYPETAVARLRFIRRAHGLGFTLDEVAALLRLDGARACAPTRALAVHRRTELQHKIADLTALRSALDRLIDQCDQHHGDARCPIIATLAGAGHEAAPPG